MFGQVWEWAGQLRVRELNLGRPAHGLVQDLYNLTEDLKVWTDLPQMRAVRLHHRAAEIHPFQNGNGRWSRMLANLYLWRHGEPIVVWPNDVNTHVSPIRSEYIAAMRSADGGDLEPLARLHEMYRSFPPN
jgi:fido (protein-threonine AMPylation protein)